MDTPCTPLSSKSYAKIKRLTLSTETVSSTPLERFFITVSVGTKEDIKDPMSFSPSPHPSSDANIRSKRLTTSGLRPTGKPTPEQAGKLRSSTRFSCVKIDMTKLPK